MQRRFSFKKSLHDYQSTYWFISRNIYYLRRLLNGCSYASTGTLLLKFGEAWFHFVTANIIHTSRFWGLLFYFNLVLKWSCIGWLASTRSCGRIHGPLVCSCDYGFIGEAQDIRVQTIDIFIVAVSLENISAGWNRFAGFLGIETFNAADGVLCLIKLWGSIRGKTD